LPVEKKAVAAKIKMDAFTKKAAFKAIALSIKLYKIDFRIPLLVLSIFLVCTKAECRYKLCGMTVAPIIPTAIYKASGDNFEGINPLIA
jgi:hypothetical protein